MTIKTRLLCTLFAVGLIPLTVMAVSSMWETRDAIEHEAINHLNATTSLKKTAVEQYLGDLQDQLGSMAASAGTREAMEQFAQAFGSYSRDAQADPRSVEQAVGAYYRDQFIPEFGAQTNEEPPTVAELRGALDTNALALQADYIANNSNPLGEKEGLVRTSKENPYNSAHATWHPFFRDFLNRFGLYDLFLVDADGGEIVYSVYKEIDFATSLEDGPYADSGIAAAFQAAMERSPIDSPAIIDFRQYLPSYNAPAGFMSAPVFDGEERVGVLIFQFPIDEVNTRMHVDGGFGDDGETYLVGPDQLLRSASQLAPEAFSVTASFRDPENKSMQADSVSRALAGESGAGHFTGLAGNEVLASFAPINLGGLEWAVVSELDASAAFAPVRKMIWGSAAIAAVLVALIIASALYTTRKITQPLGAEPAELERIAGAIADGDLTGDRKNSATSGVLRAMSVMVSGLRSLIEGIIDGSQRQASASQELAAVTSNNRVSVQRQREQTEQVASSMEEMSASISEVSQNTQDAARAVESAQSVVERGSENVRSAELQINSMANELFEANTSIQALRDNMDGIRTVLETITGIADQTNLLALNAAIEAARAGEQGRGFAIVADEVRALAGNTQGAIDEIKETMNTLFTSSENASEITARATDQAKAICDTARSTVEELEDNRRRMEEVSGMTAQVASAAEQQSTAADQISQSVASISDLAVEIDSAMSQITEASEDLAKLSESMQGSVSSFRL